MEKEKMHSYESPQMEVIEVEVEQGFATSPGVVGAEGLGDQENL